MGPHYLQHIRAMQMEPMGCSRSDGTLTTAFGIQLSYGIQQTLLLVWPRGTVVIINTRRPILRDFSELSQVREGVACVVCPIMPPLRTAEQPRVTSLLNLQNILVQMEDHTTLLFSALSILQVDIYFGSFKIKSYNQQRKKDH